MEAMHSWSRSPLSRVSTTDCWLTWSTWWIRAAMAPTCSIMVPSVPVASSTARMRTAPLSAVWVRVALISWIEAEVWSTFAASASALRARLCICEAISTMVEEVSSVELDCISAPFAI